MKKARIIWSYTVDKLFDQGFTETLQSMAYYPVLQATINVEGRRPIFLLVVRLLSSGDYWVQVAHGSHLNPEKVDDGLVESLKDLLFGVVLALSGVELVSRTMFWDIVSPDSPQLYIV